MLAWPELYEQPDALAALMQDLPADAQRIIHIEAPAAGHPLVERYARRALVAGPLAGETQPPPGPAVRTVTASWGNRGAVLAAVLEQDDPASLSLWCADRAGAALAESALPGDDATIAVVTGDAPPAARIVAWDLPTPARLAQLAAAGEVVLLVPPHAHGYVTRVTARQTPLRIADAAESARQAAARGRGAIAGALERGGLDGELLALAPLFERHDPARVAAALYRLWQAKGQPAAESPAATAAVAAPAGLVATARIWIGLGKKDGTTAADIVAALTKDLRVEAARIGRIELRETYSLVEVPADDAEAIARRLNGKLIRRRTVVAKVDLGSGGRRGPAVSAGSRGPSGSSPRGRPGRPRP
jgi:ATP-dependent RNA helicase DeaD